MKMFWNQSWFDHWTAKDNICFLWCIVVKQINCKWFFFLFYPGIGEPLWAKPDSHKMADVIVYLLSLCKSTQHQTVLTKCWPWHQWCYVQIPNKTKLWNLSKSPHNSCDLVNSSAETQQFQLIQVRQNSISRWGVCTVHLVKHSV